MLAYALFFSALAAVCVLTVRDRAVGNQVRERLLAAGSWGVLATLVFGVAGGRDHPEPYLLTMSAVWITAIAATGLRPALVMDLLLTSTAKRDPSLVRRARRGQVAVIAVVVCAALGAALAP